MVFKEWTGLIGLIDPIRQIVYSFSSLLNDMLICYFFSYPHLVDNQMKNVDERGRNFMCERTLPSLIVVI